MKRPLLITVFLLSFMLIKAQDTLKVMEDSIPKHSPHKATIMSLALPGLGQAYNKKYWKIPLAIAVIGVPLLIGLEEQSKFDDFKSALGKRLDDDPNTVDDKYMTSLSNQNLRSLIDFHRKNRDIFFILTGVGYILNVVDAAVDAHFYDFDVSDDLSATIKPTIMFHGLNAQASPSLTLSLKFTKKKGRRSF